MENIIARTNERIRPLMSSWPNVATVTQLFFGEDRLDPNFMISYDVYVTGPIPSVEERSASLDFATMFEASVDDEKDRFLIDDIPVRLEYKNREHVEKQILAVTDMHRGVRDESTYGYFRLLHSSVLVSNDDWIERMRAALSDVSGNYWERRISRLRSHMEHVLGDLTAALYGEDQLFYLISLAGFLSSVCSLMFAINRRFEPAPRSLHDAVLTLDVQPPEFSGRFVNLLREDTAVSRVRKRELAQLIARSMLYL